MDAILVPPSNAKQTELTMSYEEFLDWVNEDIRAEWVDGEVIIHMSVKPVHQAVLEFLHTLLNLFVNLFQLGRVHTAPVEALILPGYASREPDLFFVAKENLHRLTEDKLVGPADLIVEIVSDDSVRRDRRDKFSEYRQAGVKGYWIIDPRPGKQRADFFHLDDKGEYVLFATEDDERVESYVLKGFWIHPSWLWQTDTVDPLTAFCEMAGLPAQLVEQFRQQLQAGFQRPS